MVDIDLIDRDLTVLTEKWQDAVKAEDRPLEAALMERINRLLGRRTQCIVPA